MDFDFNTVQQQRLTRLAELLGPAGPMGSVVDGLPGREDAALRSAVRADALLTGPDVPLLDRVLLVEEAARRGAAMHATAELLLVPLVAWPSGAVPKGCVAVRVGGPDDPVRAGAHAEALLDVGEGDVAGDVGVANVTPSGRTPLESGFGSGYAIVTPTGRASVTWRGSVPAARVYRLGLAAEIAGAAHAAIECTAGYLVERRAFGRPLSTFQALRHRLSELAVDAAGTSALVRWAAWEGAAAPVASAVASACATAAALPPELHQLCGARGFTADFGLSPFTMLLQALRIELGGGYDAAAEYATKRWTGE